MSVTTTSAPQQGVAMPAVDVRQLFGGLISTEGIRQVGDLAVAQHGAGNMSVDVAAGSCVIQDDHGSGGGFYSSSFATTSNPTISASDPTNPRIDRVVVRVRDQFLGDATNAIDVFVVNGTPTAGATLANLNGAAAVPNSCLLLANVLVPAAATSVLTANIGNVVQTLRGTAAASNTYRKTTATDVVNTVTETDLLAAAITIAANALGANGIARVRLWGDYLNNSGATRGLQIKVKFGATTAFDSGSVVSIAASANRRPWVIEFMIVNQAATNVQFLEGDMWMGEQAAGGATVTGIGALLLSATASDYFGGAFASNGTLAEDTTAAKSVVVTCTHSIANASLSMRCQGALVEVIS